MITIIISNITNIIVNVIIAIPTSIITIVMARWLWNKYQCRTNKLIIVGPCYA